MKDGIKRIINSDYTLSVFSKIIIALVGVVSSAFSTRYLGVQYKGDYAYITHVANIIVLILNMGIYQSYSYNLKKYGKSILRKYTDICYLQFSFLIIFSIALMIAIKNLTVCLIVILVPFNILKMQYSNIGLIEDIRLSLLLNLFSAILSAMCYMALFFWAKPSIVPVVILTVTVDIITVLVFCIKLRVTPRIWEIDITFLKEVIRFGIIPMLSGLLATINYSIDIIFLKKIGTPEELSYYALAANIINYVWLIPDAFKSVLFSKSAKKLDMDSLEFSSQVSMMFIFLCFVGFAILGQQFLMVFYGNDFKNSYGVTLLLIIGAFAMSIYKLIGIVLVSQGKRGAHFVSLAISAAINVALNYLLIPKLGMYGAGVASVCSYTVCAAVLLAYFCKMYSIPANHLIFPSANVIMRVKSLFVR